VVIREEIAKAKSDSLKKKLLFVKKLTKDREVIEKQYKKELIELQFSYEDKYKRIYEDARKLISGQVTTTNNLLTPEDIQLYNIKVPETPTETGVPSFWNRALINSKYFYTNKNDEEILKFLNEVRMEFKEDKVSFTVFFRFDTNTYFNNVELSKSFFYNETQELLKVESTIINWASDEKNPTKVLAKKTKKQKGKQPKTTSQWEEVESFFKIFKSMVLSEAEDEYDANVEEQEAEFMKDDFIPYALNYYLNIMPIEGQDDDEDSGDHDTNDLPTKENKKDEGKEKCKNQ